MSVAVVLSRTDSDGSHGLEEIRTAAGITIAQEPGSAKFDGMPKSAIATGCIDFVLSPMHLASQARVTVRFETAPGEISRQSGGDPCLRNRIGVALRRETIDSMISAA
jgi:CheB methylesterase